LLENGSAEIVVLWKKTTVVEVDIDDEALHERFKELFKKNMEKRDGNSWLKLTLCAVDGIDAIGEGFR
jgi:hypothetical protein